MSFINYAQFRMKIILKDFFFLHTHRKPISILLCRLESWLTSTSVNLSTAAETK